jgi:hypothetical protein
MDTLTTNEVFVLNQLLENHDGEDLTSPYGSQNYPNEVCPIGWNAQQQGGLISSLLKKGFVNIYNGKEYSLGCDVITITEDGINALKAA